MTGIRKSNKQTFITALLMALIVTAVCCGCDNGQDTEYTGESLDNLITCNTPRGYRASSEIKSDTEKEPVIRKNYINEKDGYISASISIIKYKGKGCAIGDESLDDMDIKAYIEQYEPWRIADIDGEEGYRYSIKKANHDDIGPGITALGCVVEHNDTWFEFMIESENDEYIYDLEETVFEEWINTVKFLK